MKFRTDFVTNSSSSSFIVAFETQADYVVKDAEMQKLGIGERYRNQICLDIADCKVSRDDVKKYIEEAVRSDLSYYFYFRNPKTKDLGYKEFEAYRKSIEYKREYDELFKKWVSETMAKLPKRASHYAIINYSDNDGDFYSELEHRIMPYLPFVKHSINNH